MKSDEPFVVLGQQIPADATVLVISDQYLVSSALAYSLRDKGFNAHSLPVTDHAAVPKAALAYAPGIALLDLGSGPNGQPIHRFDLIDALRAAGWNVIVITGMTSLDRIADAVALLLTQSPMAPLNGSSIASASPSSSTPRSRTCTDGGSSCPPSALT